MTNEEINLAVAAIAGCTDIEIPNYVESLDAIVKVFDCLDLDWNIGKDCDAYSLVNEGYDHRNAFGETPALALCNLLLKINPTPISPPQVAIIDDDGEIESPVFEVEFI
jgi:hypothetical protein